MLIRISDKIIMIFLWNRDKHQTLFLVKGEQGHSKNNDDKFTKNKKKWFYWQKLVMN